MDIQYIAGVIRHFLTLGAGALVAHGFATQDMATQLVGGAMAALGIAWSLYNKYIAYKALVKATVVPSKK